MEGSNSAQLIIKRWLSFCGSLLEATVDMEGEGEKNKESGWTRDPRRALSDAEGYVVETHPHTYNKFESCKHYSNEDESHPYE